MCGEGGKWKSLFSSKALKGKKFNNLTNGRTGGTVVQVWYIVEMEGMYSSGCT